MIPSGFLPSDSDAVLRKGSFTEVPLADVCPTGSSDNELRIVADLLHIKTEHDLSYAFCSVSRVQNCVCLGRE